MVAIRNPKNLRNLNDVTQPGGLGLPDQGVPVLHSSNSSFVIQTIAAGGGGGSFSLGASNLGNTLGQTGVTGTRVVLAGIGNLTLSQLTDANGGTISISGGTAGAGFSAGVSGGNTAGDTGATGTRLVFAGGQSVTLSQATDANGGTITISGASTSQSVQTQNMVAATAAGNTSGVLALVSSGTLTLAGGNSITLSQNGNAITISGATTSQSVQTQSRFNLTLSGNTAGVMAQISSGTLTLAGGNNITLSQNGNAVTISGAAAGGAQTAISGIVGSNATYTSGTVTFTGVGGGVTVSSNTGQRIDISVAAPVAQTNQAGSVFAVGNTTSSTSGTYDARTLSLRGDGIISIAATNSGFRISATQSNDSGGVYAVGNTYSSSSGTFDVRTMSLRGDGIISIAATNSGFRISASQSVQPETQTFLGGLANSQTTYTSGTVSLSELGAITIRSTTGNQYQFSVNSQTLQTSNVHNVTLSGNTSGVMAQVSSGTMTLAGGNNITLSQAGNAITISGANIGGAQTGISGLANSQTTYTSGTVSMSELGAITIRSTTGNQFQFSVNAQTEQTQSRFNLTISGNTAGAGALISSGVMTLAGGNNITLSQAGNAVTISGGAGGAFSAGVSTGGNTAGDTGVTGSRLVFVGTNNVTLSQATAAAGGTITISGPTTVAQTNQSGGAYAVGNTYSSSSGTFDARTLSIRGDGIISVAATNSGWRISASQSVQAETQTFVGGIAASNTTYTSGTITITGVGGGVTVSSNTGQRVDISVAAPVAQTNQSGGVYAVGNTYSSSSGTIDARTISLRGDGIISVAATNSGWRISAAAQTGISSIVASDATYTSGSVQFTGSNMITVRSSANQRVVIDATQSVQTQNLHNVTLSGNTAGAMAQISSGTLTLAGGANITLSQAGNAVTISGGGGSSSDTDVTAITQAAHGLAVGDWVRLSGTSYIKAQADSEANAEVVGVVSAVADVDNFTLTTGGLVTGLSGLTAGAIHYLSPSTAGAITTTQPTAIGEVSKPVLIARSTTSGYVYNMRGAIVPTTATSYYLAGLSNVGNTSGNTGITGSRLVLAGGNNITLSQSTNASGGTVTISAFTQTLQTSNVHNVTLSGNTAGAMAQISSGTLTLAGGNNITLSQAGNAVTISGGAGGGFSGGVSNLGNTGGATGVTGTRLVFVGSNNVTLSQTTDANGGTVSLFGQAPAGGAFSGGVSTDGNTAGATGISGTQMVLAGIGAMSLSQTTGANGNTVSILAPATSSLTGANGITISTNGSTISVIAPASSSLVGASGVSLSTAGSTISIFETSGGLFAQEFNPYSAAPQTNAAQGQGILHIQPMEINPDLRMDRVLLGQWISNAANSSGSITITQAVGIYTRTGSTLSLVTSVSTSLNFTGSGTVSSYSSYGGRRWMTIPLTTTLSQGDYYMAIMHRSTTGGAAGHTVQQILLTQQSNATFSGWSGILGAATNATMQHILGMGTYSASTATPPASIGFTQIQGSGTLAMMPPMYALRSGTV